MNVLGLINRADYCEWWRVLWPFAELRKHGIRADVAYYNNLSKVDVGPYDVIVTPRVTFGGTHSLVPWLREARKLGKKWVYDADDNLWCNEFVHRQMEHMLSTEPILSRTERRRKFNEFNAARAQRLKAIQNCDMITVSTEALAQQVRELTAKPVVVVPNLVDVEEFDRAYQRHPRMTKGLCVGWTGGHRLDEDLYPLGEAWSEIARRYPNVTFVVYGYEPKSLMTSVPEDRLAVIEWTTIGMYPAGLKNIDIGCCVLPDTPWNSAKSPNKWYEFALAGVPCVVSPTVYGQIVGDNALIANTVEEWVTQLCALIEDRGTLGERARATVRANYNLARGWTQWPTVWSQFSNAM